MTIMKTIGQQLPTLLYARQVRHIFGIPGAHTIELYRGLENSNLTHITPRHEQSAGFMADGYARISGKPGVAFVITGPGMLNIATPMAQAKADSIPMIVIAGVNARTHLGMQSGDLHEVEHQSQIARSCAILSHTLTDASQLKPFLDKAFALLESARPGPVCLEIPVDLFAMKVPDIDTNIPAHVHKPAPSPKAIELIAACLNNASTPLIIAGGGSITAANQIEQLASSLDIPVVMTSNARGVLAEKHPLAVSVSPSLKAVRDLVGASDVVLMLGSELGNTDYNAYERKPFNVKHTLIRVDIDSAQLHNKIAADIAINADVKLFLDSLLPLLENKKRKDVTLRISNTHSAAILELEHDMHCDLAVIKLIQSYFPASAFVGDSTQLVYAGNLFGGISAPRRWFNAATGFGALGFGVPAAIGAAIASRKQVVCLVGDGGLQFSLAELSVAVELHLPVVFIVWNNQGYGEIERYMNSANIKAVGVKLHTPDFVAVAKAMGMQATKPETLDAFEKALLHTSKQNEPYLIDLEEGLARSFQLRASDTNNPNQSIGH